MLTSTNHAFALVANAKVRSAIIVLAATLAVTGCAVLQPPNADGPKGNEPLYPLLFTEDSHRKEALAVSWNRLALQTGTSNATEPQLQPVAPATLNFSPKADSSLYLPKVGATAVMNEEETRESLRRFIREWQELIGSDPAKLSLTERIDQPDGSKVANYEQRPFRYPIRGNYGRLQIRFGSDRRILNLTSNCIPDAEQMQTALSALTVRLKAEDAVQQLRQNGVAYLDPNGNQSNLKLPAASAINPKGLVTYIRPAKNRPDALEFHLAWEVEVSDAPIRVAYVDAITGDTVGAA